MFNRDRERRDSTFKGNDEDSSANNLQRFNREKRRLASFLKQEPSPKNKNTIIGKTTETQQTLNPTANNICGVNKEKQLFEYDFEEGREFQAYYPHNNIKEIIKHLIHVNVKKGTTMKSLKKSKFREKKWANH